MSLLEAEGLQVRYGSGRTSLVAVDGISLRVEPGASLGIVGESGSGKSTLARAIVQIVPTAAGRLVVDGRDVTNAQGRALRHVRDRVQIVFQDPFASLNPRMTIGATLDEAVRLRRRRVGDGGNRHEEVEQLLEFVTLESSVLARYPNQLSGGQLQRVSIARALASRPRLLILDEVTSALDVSVQAAILNLLHHLRETLGLAFMCISHDLSVIGYLCETVMVLYLGQAVEVASCSQLFASPRHPYSRTLLDSVPQVHGDLIEATVGGDVPDPRHPPLGCRFHPRCPRGPLAHPERLVCGTDDPHASRRVDGSGSVACHFPLEPTASNGSAHAA
jgi:oligopeptide/dipeptide ABC transporter ATP-binding protein